MSAAPTWSVVVRGGSDAAALERTRASLAQADPGHVEVVEVTDVDHVAAFDHGLRRSTGQWVAFVDAGDEIAAGAFGLLDAEVAGAAPDLVTADEDRIFEDRHVDPWYKPAWSPDRLRCDPYVGRPAFVRRELALDLGGLRAETGDAQEHDLHLRVGEHTRAVHHVDDVLLHRALDRSFDEVSTQPPPETITVIAEHVARTGFPGTPEWDPQGVFRVHPALREQPRVSIVIPTAGKRSRLRGQEVMLAGHCARTIAMSSTYPNYEIVCVVDRQVPAAARAELAAVAPVRLVEGDEPFNFSARINRGVMSSRGDYVLLLNDDTEVMTPDWIERMLMYAVDPDVGAVGATLLFDDGRIQHAGVTMVDGNPAHPYYGFPGEWSGYRRILQLPSNRLAVTAACLLTRRDVFRRVGGFSEAFPLNYNDVDFCLKVHRARLRIVHTPDARLHHFESATRGAGEVRSEELDLLDQRWGSLTGRDPFYSRHFLRTADFLVPVPAELRPRVVPTS